MQHIGRNSAMVIALVLLCLAAIFPPERNLRLGKDLAGGVSLTYPVDVKPSDPANTVDQTIGVLKDRLDPNGMKELSIVQQGRDRIEISFPLPNDEVKALRGAYESELDKLRSYEIDPAAFERAMRGEGETRVVRLEEMIDGSAAREQMLRPVIDAVVATDAARAAYESHVAVASADDDQAATLLNAAVDAEEALEVAREGVTTALVSADDVRNALQLSPVQPRVLNSQTGNLDKLDSPRQLALDSVRTRCRELDGATAGREMGAEEKGEVEQTLDGVLAAHATYAEQQQGFDDPNEVIRLLRGAGVLTFRIAIEPGIRADEQVLRQQLRDRGPEAIAEEGVRWFALNKLEDWFDDTDGFARLTADPGNYFQGRYNLIVEERDGVYYMLFHDDPTQRMTRAEGDWGVRNASQGIDPNGRPAINFTMDPRGATLMGQLTDANVGRPMGVLLDDKVYTAPNINQRLTDNIQIHGSFQMREINEIIKMLNAGSLSARLGDRPISQNTLAPTLGKDNLMKGLEASWIALLAVCVFMVFYYFSNGLVAVIALATNAVLILGAMSLARAAFTLPGIAGIVLTFGMAVDANVLIYERIREELAKGNDLKSSIRISYQKVLSTIVDANITNLIVCFVLAYTATPEVKGFAITLGIGIVATLFSALIVTRLIYAIMLDFVKIKTMRQLPIVIPTIDKVLTPKLDFIGLRPVFAIISLVLVGGGIFLVASQGSAMLGTEFRGGTEVTVELREGETLTREDVEGRVQGIVAEAESAQGADTGDAEAAVLALLTDATVVPVNPDADGVTSDVFKIASTISEDEATELSEQQVLGEAIVEAFADVIDQRQPLRFDGWESEALSAAPINKVIREDLGSNIGRPEVRIPVDRYVGGVAVVMDNFETPLPSKDELEKRLEHMRSQPDYSGLLKRAHELVVMDGSDVAVESAVLLSVDPTVSFYTDEARWNEAVAGREWSLVKDALTGATTLAGVQSFSASIARDFKAQAIVAVVLSFLLILAYIWARFGSVRYSLAAIAALVHDVITVLGLIALAEILYENFPGLAAIGIQPFKIDLGLVAAILTIIGYSLNDTIVILDRIRENRGKLAYASRECVNTSISQTLSRTLITSGTTLVALLVMFVIGGEGIASFTYALLCGVLVGTYSSVAVASPMVFSRKIPPASRRYAPSGAAEAERELVGSTS